MLSPFPVVCHPRNRQEILLFSKPAAVAGVLALVLGPSFMTAQQFTADLIRSKPAGAANSKIYVSGDKIRFETVGAPNGSAVIMDLTQGTSMMLVPDNKSYIVNRPGYTPHLTPFFRVADPDNACEAWEKAAGKPGTCTKVGDDRVGERKAVKYSGTAQNGDTGYAWVDRSLHFVIKWEGQKTAAEFQNIQEGPQAAALFLPPPGYDKMDLAQPKADFKSNPSKAKTRTPVRPVPQE
jgi:hypothetical protein